MSDPRTRPLLEVDADPDPFRQLRAWFDDALARSVATPEAMTVATASPDGRPSARMVLCRGFGPDGFVFYTDRRSRKAAELTANPHAALLFSWEPVGRQVRIEGTVGPVDDATADAYFAGRPRGSQLGAWASSQSAAIRSRAALEADLAAIAVAREGSAVQRPPHWGGFRVVAETIELWQHRDDRLHDRLRYRRLHGDWSLDRLSP